MKKWVAGITLAVIATTTSSWADDASNLLGVWKVTSWVRRDVSSGQEARLFGDKPGGYIIFTKGGHFSWQGYNSQRAKPEAIPTDAERVGLFKTMFAYGGSYQVDGSSISEQV